MIWGKPPIFRKHPYTIHGSYEEELNNILTLPTKKLFQVSQGDLVGIGKWHPSSKKYEQVPWKLTYCWWKKSCTSWYGESTSISKVFSRFYTSQVVRGLLPSTVSPTVCEVLTRWLSVSHLVGYVFSFPEGLSTWIQNLQLREFETNTLPETKIAPENSPSQKETHPFSGATLVSVRVSIFPAWKFETYKPCIKGLRYLKWR